MFCPWLIPGQGSDILALFVYPDSRAQFVEMLRRAGLLSELKASLGVSASKQALEFWSYSSGIDGLDDNVAADSRSGKSEG